MSQPVRILLALAIGLSLGILTAAQPWTERAIAVADPIGGLWLDALRMTIVPLVVSLLVTGIAASAEAARANRLTARAIMLFLAVLWTGAIMSALLTPLLLQAWPLPSEAAGALRAALAGTGGEVGEVPTFGQFLRSLVPTNPVSAAAEDRILPLLVFTLIFAFAVTRLPAEQRAQLVGFFRAVADAMLIVINWVLFLAPIGVLALAYVVGARAGASALGALGHYVLVVALVGSVVWFSAWPLAAIGGRVGFGRYTRAIGAPHAVAISTQSSLASLPAMLKASERLGVPVAASGVVLPLAVAIYVAHLMNVPLTPWALAAGVAVAATTTLGSVSLPGSVSFIASIAPICYAMNVPVEPLLLLIAVETLPDIVRTTGNVSMDVAATATVARRSGFDENSPHSEQDRLLEEGA